MNKFDLKLLKEHDESDWVYFIDENLRSNKPLSEYSNQEKVILGAYQEGE